MTAAGLPSTLGAQSKPCVLVVERAVSEERRKWVGTLPGVSHVVTTSDSCRLTSRCYRSESSTVTLERGRIAIGGNEFVVAAGPCAVESEELLGATADAVVQRGAVLLRGGAFKPRTSPYSFQGLGESGLDMLDRTRHRTGMPTVTEVLEPSQVDRVARSSDMLQIGARNMQNFPLLKAVGRSGRPVLLKRGISATVEEWLSAAEYILSEGNFQVVLCERGIRTYENSTRFTLDLSAVPVVKSLSHLPVIVDPSHSSGRVDLVKPLALAAAAVGADGLIIDVHVDSREALCDANQALAPEQFASLMGSLDRILTAVNRPLARLSSTSKPKN
ncbi:3-deoxy-7-phosphoheptulonate synthase [Pendulispora rubella]|uniref:3-deoxy-7-phosphoheptulonate synthase n=2 Tax=Pendulispora rubella TaxID=2741070 RepID=A0ABZ2LPE0_9BACT